MHTIHTYQGCIKLPIIRKYNFYLGCSFGYVGICDDISIITEDHTGTDALNIVGNLTIKVEKSPDAAAPFWSWLHTHLPQQTGFSPQPWLSYLCGMQEALPIFCTFSTASLLRYATILHPCFMLCTLQGSRYCSPGLMIAVHKE